ncbi:MAG: dehydratase [Planctomycetes bacterium]|nr:dehydratase [Planctomycetota bacterium]
MTGPLHFEDLNVGDRWVSLGRTITETDIVNFAGMTGDFDPLHVDHEYAKQTPFGKPIAHGLLGLSLVAGLASQNPCIRTIAFLRIDGWEFHKPIYVGDTVYAETEVTAKEARGNRSGKVTWRRRLVDAAGHVLQSGTFETLVAVARAARKPADPVQSAEAAAYPAASTPMADRRIA